MSLNVLYRTTAVATGGRDGRVATTDGGLDLALGMPKELGGAGVGNNPEQLFASGYAACFLSAMKFVGTQEGFAKVPAEATVKATVGIGPRSDKGFGLDVALEISLPGVDRAEAEALVAEADTVCPYSHATRGNISVTLTVA
ncbi:organic hydroperoxide resistance protein [Brevundimonas sp.]|jgi:lipoyl-dependent peroxiredoxin|uniref:organic hydroperoxide resistance protein n=1 Tax=Brevundimonas sp. TaxID=1871086 RepID=UPI00185C9076|nr:organic hydroperoxide resistance protein [Brevundimonas sp.]MBA4807299.1 organic hydroperoxide resistance protein [Brevundimonas sp.]